MRADLHCHTRISDGSLGISDLIVVASRLKIKYLAVTDHDTMGAVSRAGVVGKRYGVDVVPGVEISAYDEKNDKPVHLLCYLPDYPDRMEGYFKRMSDERMRLFEIWIKKICTKLPINPQMVTSRNPGCATVFPCHIMHTLVDCAYTGEIYGDLYRALFGKGKLCEETCNYGSYTEVMQLIKSSGGIAVLAHPAQYNNFDIIDDLIGLGLDGIEYEHYKNSSEDKLRIKKIAEENGLLLTGGTDFHGMYDSPLRPLGTNTVTEVEVEALYARKDKKKVMVSI